MSTPEQEEPLAEVHGRHQDLPPPKGGRVGEGGSDRETRARRVGRRVARGLYYAVVLAVVTMVTVQVTRQVFFPAAPAAAAPFASCAAGVDTLYAALERARGAAEAHVEGEEAALARFRAALAPEWEHFGAAQRLCAADRERAATLDALARLRYSEEHGVRNQAAELANLRRFVRERLGRRPETR